MSIFAIADLHLGLSVDKPMDVFGPSWQDHVSRLEENWRSKITPSDTVLIPGDISWGISMEEALADLLFIESLPGTKILSKGNHDYWWGTTKKVEENIDIIEKAEIEIDRIAELIKKGEVLETKKIGSVEYSVTKWVRDVYYKDFMKTKKFKATDKCISCQKCVKVCPLSNITMVDKRPSWGTKCTHCMACINQCPVDAIEYGKGTAGKPRYKGPDSAVRP